MIQPFYKIHKRDIFVRPRTIFDAYVSIGHTQDTQTYEDTQT